ncbi:MAG: GDP-mannose 4,6-dehydratase [Gemmatimonadetes bacterium]|nr:GDP-mannose 4,6-dehydratase [Gemmatimonadota bacterium]
MKKALITGITGQDGSYLAELLLGKGYEVHGTVRRVSLEAPDHRMHRIRPFLDRLVLHSTSLDSYPSLFNVIRDVVPDECYHLAAQSFVGYSMEDEFSTLNANINGTHYVLAALKDVAPSCRLYFAGSSEMFGAAETSPQTERTPFHPTSAYGISKVAAFHLVRNYRERHRLFACSGMLFNHESPRRPHEFVTRKITSNAVKISRGESRELRLGNLDARRDWGHAREYVDAMWRMLQLDAPDDFVIATNTSHSVREFCEAAFRHLDLDYREYVKVDPMYFRPAEVSTLQGDPTKARRVLGWENSISFEDLVAEMVDADLALEGRP